jgi:hypothetical protein
MSESKVNRKHDCHGSHGSFQWLASIFSFRSSRAFYITTHLSFRISSKLNQAVKLVIIARDHVPPSTV